MAHRLTNFLTSKFPDLIRTIRLMEPQHPYLYHVRLSKSPNYQKTDAYQVGLLCGEACFLTRFLLDIEGFTSEVWKNHQGYGDYYTDHCFIWLPEMELMVDPTYKQFFSDPRLSDETCPYHHYIYKTLPPIFVGTRREMDDLIQKATTLNEKHYQTSNLQDIWKYWRFNQNITGKFNLSNCLQDPNYFREKPGYYLKAVKSLKPDLA